MKIIKVFSLSLGIIFFSNTEILSDDLEFRLIEIRNDRKIHGEFHIGLQIKVLTGSYPRTLNSITADINYGSRLSSYSARPDINWVLGTEYASYVQKLPGFYRVLVINTNVNSEGNSTPTGNPPGWDVTNNWQTIVTLRLIIESLGEEKIIINDYSDAAAYFKNYTNAPQGEVTDWIVFNQDLEISIPVELSIFQVQHKENQIELTWQTATEINNYGFEVERRVGIGELDMGGWEKIGFVPGNGSSSTPYDYFFEDKNPSGGSKFIYRLKQIDYDGKFEYSKEVEVDVLPKNFNLFQNYPNPFNPVTIIKFALPMTAKVRIIVYNLVGEKVATLLDENKDAGYYDIQFNSDNLSSGVYIYRLTAENFVQTKKMMLIR